MGQATTLPLSVVRVDNLVSHLAWSGCSDTWVDLRWIGCALCIRFTMRLSISEGIFEHNHRCYRNRRIRAPLGKQQVFMSWRNRPAPEKLINRDVRAAAPNEKWLTDITECRPTQRSPDLALV